MSKVSIIIPFYNVEEYIIKCLTSITNQTLKDIEIILINDCSTDNSLNLVLENVKNDERVIILNTEKKSGQSTARNLGLKRATGEYIGFVDADDWVALDMFEKMYNRAKEDNTDITMCQSELYDTKTQKFQSDGYYCLNSLQKYGNNVFNADIAKDELLNTNVVLWNKIYKKEFLERINVKFQDGYIYEDLPFFFETYINASKVNIIWESLYYYRQNRTLSTMENITKKIFDRIPMVEYTYNILQKAPFFEDEKINIISWMIDDIFHRYTLLENQYYEEYYDKMQQFFRSFNLSEQEIEKLDTCYCYEEFCHILKCSFYEFGNFLIDKYKTANKLIKELKHKNNQTIAKLNAYWKKYSHEQEEEKKEINKWWKDHCDEEIKKAVESEIQQRLDMQFKFLESKKEYEMNKLYNEMYGKLVLQEQELKKWQAESVKAVREELFDMYQKRAWALEDEYHNYLEEQKEYYEYHFLLISILFKFYKFFDKVKYKIKKKLNKN